MGLGPRVAGLERAGLWLESEVQVPALALMQLSSGIYFSLSLLLSIELQRPLALRLSTVPKDGPSYTLPVSSAILPLTVHPPKICYSSFV